jgi:hypothetical protein
MENLRQKLLHMVCMNDFYSLVTVSKYFLKDYKNKAYALLFGYRHLELSLKMKNIFIAYLFPQRQMPLLMAKQEYA